MLPTTLEDDEEGAEDEPQIRAGLAPHNAELRVTNPDLSPQNDALGNRLPALSERPLCAALSEASVYSSDTCTSQEDHEDGDMDTTPEHLYLPGNHRPQGNLELEDGAGSDEELEAVLQSAKVDQGHFGNIPSAGRSRRSGGRSSKGKKPQQHTAFMAPPRSREDTTPRMEGIGSGMRALSKNDKEKKLLSVRLQERAKRGLSQPLHSSSSGFSAMDSDDVSTPKAGYSSGAPPTTSEDEMPVTTDSFLGPGRLQSRPSRRLPYPPSTAASKVGSTPMRHSHIGIFHRPSKSLATSDPPKGFDLWGNRLSQKSVVENLPCPPVIPTISGRVTATSLRTAKSLQDQTTISDSETLYKATIDPFKSPVRPPRSPLRINSSVVSEEGSGGGNSGPIGEKFKTLEHRARSN